MLQAIVIGYGLVIALLDLVDNREESSLSRSGWPLT